MYSIFKVDENRLLLFDSLTAMPPLYVLLYSKEVLFQRKSNTQRNNLVSIKLFYDFWLAKYQETFDYSFFKSNYRNIEDIVENLPDFFLYLQNGNLYAPNIVLISDGFKTENSTTCANHVIRGSSFIKFLITRYISSSYINEPLNNIHAKFRQLNCLLDTEIGKYRKLSQLRKRSSFKSLNLEMLQSLIALTIPSSKHKYNVLNPYNDRIIQFRNYLIFRLLYSYGLRVGELLSLTINSIKLISSAHATRKTVRNQTG